ncbi:MAG: hypothetical protein JWQ76_4129 [Ramlibacter sp.]|nr:hypothetical protein [Ramlibacter sp.]
MHTSSVASVGIRLQRFVDSRILRMVSARPISTLSKSRNEATAHGVAERLTDWTEAAGITLVCTRLLDEISGKVGAGTPVQISTLLTRTRASREGELARGLKRVRELRGADAVISQPRPLTQ